VALAETLQATSLRTFSLQKFLNRIILKAVFMIEGRRVLAREAILSGAATAERSRDEVLEALVRAHSRLVYRIAYAVLRRHHEAEDAAQETFLRVVRYSSRLAAVEDPRTWLARIAWRVAVEFGRRNARKQETPLEDPEKPMQEVTSPDASADQTIQETQIGAVLEKLIAALPEKLRAPLILSAIEEMSSREIAATLDINEAAVRSRVFRARQILKEKLAQRGHR
jgi:RNA polymerase sigma-70 factor (ECF subfamily)